MKEIYCKPKLADQYTGADDDPNGKNATQNGKIIYPSML
jgi:hypothetical protein